MIILPNTKSSIYKQRGSKILVGGFFSGTFKNRIARLNSNATLDPFAVGTGFGGQVNAIAVQSDGKIFVGGSFTDYNGTTTNRITKLNSNGTLDDNFTSGGSRADNEVKAVAIQSVDNIIIGGAFTSYNGVAQNRITRLKSSDGSRSATLLSIGTGFDAEVSAIAIQSDLKILVGGQFTSYNGTTQNYITRLNSNGPLDTSFSIGDGFDNYVRAIAIQPDGKILVGGDFYQYDGTYVGSIIRLNSDGTLDYDFIELLEGSVKTIAIQPDGKILVGGSFTAFGRNCIARLNSDGTNDTSFTTTGTSGTPINSIAVQPDGKIIAGGEFTLYNGLSQSRIVRLNTNGSVDTSFTVGSTFNGAVNTILIS